LLARSSSWRVDRPCSASGSSFRALWDASNSCSSL
jgi:hypothetical protein